MLESIVALVVAALWPFQVSSWVAPAAPATQPAALALAPALPVPQLLAQAAGGLSASSVVVLAGDGTMLYQRDADTPRFIASLTKLMTALVAVDAYEPTMPVRVSRGATTVGGSGIGLAEGDVVPVGDLLQALLVASANDAAVALADAYPHGKEAFIDAMNAKAKAMGLRHTHFANTTGLDDPQHYSTAHDMAQVLQAAQQNTTLAPLLTQQYVELHPSTTRTLQAQNTNKLLWSPALRVRAGKTGTTDGAGECLLVSADIAGQPYTIGVLGSSQRFTDVRRIITSLQGHLQPGMAAVASVPETPATKDAPTTDKEMATGGG